jgi:hypothetical protein
MTHDTALDAAEQGFRQIYLSGVPHLLQRNETAFLAFLCIVAGIDTLAGYRYADKPDEERFAAFIVEYFPSEYQSHARKLYLFRCRMLHNSSPAYFTVTHASPSAHLQPSPIGDTTLDDGSFFAHFEIAAQKFFAELGASADRQQVMLNRLNNLARGGSLWVTSR